MTPDISPIRARLRAASRLADGRLYVRQSHAAKALGLTDSRTQQMARDHGVAALRLPCGKPRGVDPGYAVFYRTASLWRAYLSRRRPWTEAERDFLLDHAGLRTRPWIARQLGRTPSAVSHQLSDLGLTWHGAQGLYTSGQIARMAGRSTQAVNLWAERGLRPSVPARGKGHYALYDLDAVRRWLLAHPGVLAGIGPLNRRRLGLDAHERKEVAA